MVESGHALFFCTDIHLFIPYHILMWSFQPNAAQQSLKHCTNVQLRPAQLNILRPTKLASIAQHLPEQNILSHHQACLDISWHHVDQTGNRMFVSFNIVIYIYWLIRLFWTLDLNFDRNLIYHNMILEPSTDFDQIWSIMSKVLWLNFCILLCAFDTYGECICFSLTSRRCSFLLWHFNFASHRICSEMGQVGSSSFSVDFVRKLLFERWYQNNIWSLSPKKNLSRFTRVGSTRQSPYLVGSIHVL